MSYWSVVTRNLIMQNSAPVQQHGGNLGSTTWSYVVGRDGVKTIDPIVGFYLNPPPKASCRWSTNNGRYRPNHIVIYDGDVNEDAMPARELVDWNDDTIQAKVEHYRQLYWMELKNMVRPNTFEDLYELFDSATLWSNGAYNLWKLVNALITLAHDQFPHVLQDWKSHIEKVVYDFFRPVTGTRLTPGEPNRNMEVLCNQQVLTEWDRIVDPLTLLERTSFPVANLPLMNVQQHGLLRELLICEHIRLTGTQSPIPQHYNHPRPVVNTVPTPVSVDNPLQRAPINNATLTEPSHTAMQGAPVDTSAQTSKPRSPLVVVGITDPDGEMKVQPCTTSTLPEMPVTSVENDQSHVLASPSPATLRSIPEEAATIKTDEAANHTSSDTGDLPLKAEPMSPDANMAAHKSVTKEATPVVEVTPTKVESQLDCIFDPSAGDVVPNEVVSMDQIQIARVEAPIAETVIREPVSMMEADLPGNGMPDSRIVTKEASPPPDSPIRDRKDSNGSADELFFPGAPSDKLHMGRQPSIASAPDRDTEPVLTIAEKTARIVSETPPAMQIHCDQQPYALQSASGVPAANDSSREGSLLISVPARIQGRQQSAPMANQVQRVPQHGRYMEPSAPHSSQMMPLFGSQNGILQGSGSINPSTPSMQAGPNGCFPLCGPPPPHSAAMQMRPPMGPPFRDQITPHVHQQFVPHGSAMNPSSPSMGPQDQYHPGYQPNGYIHQAQHYGSHSEQGDNGYSSNGYRNSDNGGYTNEYNGKRRDSIQSNASRKTRMNSLTGTVNFMPRQASIGFLGRRTSNVGGPDQKRGKPGFVNCANDRGLSHHDLLNTRFAECPCVRCEENSRSIFITLRPQPKMSDGDLQQVLLKHFAQFNPIVAKIKHNQTKLTCFIEFHNDIDMARAIHWSCDPQNQTIPGILLRAHIWYPLYSKHYVPRQRYGTQDRYQLHSPHENNRRESNPFRGQQPVDILGSNDGYIGPDFLQHNIPSAPCNGLVAAPSFPPPNGMVYQQVLPQNQPRVLFDPNAPQRRDSRLHSPELSADKTQQKLATKTAHSQDVRRSLILSEDSWRQSQAKLPSEGMIQEKEIDSVKAIENTSIIASVKSAKVSLPSEKDSAREAAARSGSPGVDNKTHDKVQMEQLQKEQPQQTEGPQKGQHWKDGSHRNKPQKDDTKKERAPTDDWKVTGKSSDKSVDSSQTISPVTSKTFEKDNALIHEPKAADEGDEKIVASSYTITPETTNLVQQDYGAFEEPKATDGDEQKSTASSRTMTPDAMPSVQSEVMTHHKKSPCQGNAIARRNTGKRQPKKADKKSEQKSEQTSDPTKQTGYRKTADHLAVPSESMELETAQTDMVTGGYSKTTGQLSSAVEDVGYSMDTVIRHKPGRPAIPASWADGRAGHETHTRTPSPIKGTQTGSAILNRINDINHSMSVYEVVMSSSAENVPGHDLVQNEASAPSTASAPNKANKDYNCPTTADVKPAAEVQQIPGPSRKKQHKKKKKAHGAGSHLTSRSNTPSDTWSRGPSPALDRPSSAAASTNASSSWGPSPGIQNNHDAPSDGAPQPRRTKDKQAKNKRMRTLPVPEPSDRLARSGDIQDNKNQSACPGSSLHKTKTSQDMPADKSTPIPAKAVNGSHVKTADHPATNNTGGSLRIPKNRSPKKGYQKSEPQGSMKNQAPDLSGAASLPAVFEPPAKKDRDVSLEASPFTGNKLTIVQTKKAAPLQMTIEEPDSRTITPKASNSNDHRVALPKIALPLLQVPQSTRPSSDWASVVKGAASPAPQADKRDYSDPFAAGRDQAVFGDFIKDKNVKSPQKPKLNNEEQHASSDKAFSTPSPEKMSQRPATSKAQLNAAVQVFNPSASCTSSPTSTKPKLNPNAAAFNLPYSLSPSVAAAVAPGHGRTGKGIGVTIAKENEKPIAAYDSVLPLERRPIKKGHAKKPSFPGHTTGLDKRFITPVEQILNADRVTQPPPPSKEYKHAGFTTDRSRGAGQNALPTANRRQTSTNGFDVEPKKQVAKDVAIGKVEGDRMAPKSTDQVTIEVVSGKPQSTFPETVHETHLDAEPKTLDNGSFPTLDQAAAAGPTKKRRAASIVKANLSAAVPAAPVSSTVASRDINAPSWASDSKQLQKGGAKTKQTHAQSYSTAPASAVVKGQQPKVGQKQADAQGGGPKQPGDKDNWHIVPPKQKNNSGANKGHGGRAGKYIGSRGTRGARGARDGSTEEQKGG